MFTLLIFYHLNIDNNYMIIIIVIKHGGMDMKYGAIIAAGGKGNRMGFGFNKVLFQMNEHNTILDETIKIFKDDPNCQEIVVILNKNDYKTCMCKMQSGDIILVSGGKTRCDSVYHGLMATRCDTVLIHDGARPYLSKELLNSVVEAAQKHKAVIPVIPVKDTIKKVVNNTVIETIEREEVYHVQTPQAFDTDLLIDCYQKAFKVGKLGTDDSQIVEMYSDEPIYTVDGEYSNIKITTIEDLPRMK